jgi:hypothetical protein
VALPVLLQVIRPVKAFVTQLALVHPNGVHRTFMILQIQYCIARKETIRNIAAKCFQVLLHVLHQVGWRRERILTGTVKTLVDSGVSCVGLDVLLEELQRDVAFSAHLTIVRPNAVRVDVVQLKITLRFTRGQADSALERLKICVHLDGVFFKVFAILEHLIAVLMNAREDSVVAFDKVNLVVNGIFEVFSTHHARVENGDWTVHVLILGQIWRIGAARDVAGE